MITPVMLIVLAIAAPIASAAEALFRCDDGTVTNRAERLCHSYEPNGIVMVAPGGSRPAAFAPFLEQNKPPPASITAQPALGAVAPDVCSLYQEWAMLNVQTGGGVTFRNTHDIPRWLSLSRIFTAIGRPQCE